MDGPSVTYKPYEWGKLTSENSVRLLQLYSSSNTSDPLRCTLVEIQIRQRKQDFENVGEQNNETSPSEEMNDDWEDIEEASEPFEAISYACGDFNPRVPLYVDRECQILITENIAAALRCLRYPDTDRSLWVDTICINQSDNAEKSQQVGIMYKIYRAASRVQIWLGDADDKTELAFSSIRRIAKERHLYGVTSDQPFQQMTEYTQPQIRMAADLIKDEITGQAISSVLERDYFYRRWIIQETTLARHLVVNCGIHCLRWVELSRLVAVLRLAMTVAQIKGGHHTWLGKAPHDAASTMLRARYRYQAQLRRRESPGGDLLSFLAAFEDSRCHDDHDLLYALLGIVDRNHTEVLEVLKPDYGKSVEDVFEALAMVYLCTKKDVRILSHVRNRPSMLPTFVPDWRVRYESELLDGNSDPSFTAGIGEFEQPAQVVAYEGQPPMVLGWYVDEILISHCHKDGHEREWHTMHPVQRACLAILGCHERIEAYKPEGIDHYPFTDELLNTALARTLVVDNRVSTSKAYLGEGFSGDKCRAILEQVLKDLMGHWKPAEAGKPAGISTLDYYNAHMDVILDPERKKPVPHPFRYLDAAAAMLENRSFFITNNMLIGIGPRGTSPDDIVAVIAGAETPFILRPVVEKSEIVRPRRTSNSDTNSFEGGEDNSGQADEYDVGGAAMAEQDPDSWKIPPPRNEKTRAYEVVGECYVHGIMDGTFMRFVERLRMFELR